MNNEIMNNEIEIEEIENTEMETDTVSVPEEESGNGLVGLIVTGLVVVAGVVLWKSKDKIKEYKNKKAIKRLEKAGYKVEKPVSDSEEEVVTEEVEAESEE